MAEDDHVSSRHSEPNETSMTDGLKLRVMAITSDIGVRLVGSFLAFLGYIAFFWRTFKSNPGNRLVECGSMTLIAFLAMVFVSQLGGAPDWLILSWIMLVVVLCFATLFFLAQRVFRAIQRHRP